jgi:hypothetical protein
MSALTDSDGAKYIASGVSENSMAMGSDERVHDEEFANGDTIAERVEKVQIDDNTCPTDEMRELLGL